MRIGDVVRCRSCGGCCVALVTEHPFLLTDGKPTPDLKILACTDAPILVGNRCSGGFPFHDQQIEVLEPKEYVLYLL